MEFWKSPFLFFWVKNSSVWQFFCVFARFPKFFLINDAGNPERRCQWRSLRKSVGSSLFIILPKYRIHNIESIPAYAVLHSYYWYWYWNQHWNVHLYQSMTHSHRFGLCSIRFVSPSHYFYESFSLPINVSLDEYKVIGLAKIKL